MAIFEWTLSILYILRMLKEWLKICRIFLEHRKHEENVPLYIFIGDFIGRTISRSTKKSKENSNDWDHTVK